MELRSSQNTPIEDTAQPYRDFCAELRNLNNTRLEELTLLGDMGILNFIRALILEIRNRELTKLQRLNVDENYLTEMEMFQYEDGSTDN